MTNISWKLLDEGLVRSCSLPYTALLQLYDVPTNALLTADLARRRQLKAAFKSLEATACREVAGCVDAVVRHKLLDLKRAAHQHDATKIHTVLTKIKAAGISLPAAVLTAANAAIAAAENVLSPEVLRELLLHSTKQERALLGKIVREQGIDSAVSVTSVSAAKAIRNLGIDHRMSAKQLARAHRTALGYVIRSATRTVPFSTLCTIAPFQFSPASAHLSDPHIPAATQAIAQWNVYAMSQIFSAIKQDFELIATLPIRVNPDALSEDAHCVLPRCSVEYLGHVGDRDLAVYREERRVVDSQGLFGKVMALAASAADSGEYTCGQLAAELSGCTGLSASQAQCIVLDAIRISALVVPDLDLSPSTAVSPQPIVGHLAQGTEKAVSVARIISHIAAGCKAVASIRAFELKHAQVLKLTRLLESLRQLVNPGIPVFHTSVYEDGVGKASTVSAHVTESCNALDWSTLAHLVDLLDVRQVERSLFEKFVSDKFPRGEICHNVPAVVNGFVSEVLTPLRQIDIEAVNENDLKSTAALPLGKAWKWIRARRHFLARIAAVRSNAAGPVDVRALLNDYLPLMRSRTYPFRSLNAYVQQDAEGELVINRTLGGPGFPWSRFAHAIPDSAAHAWSELADRSSNAGVQLVELTAGKVVSNLNAHPDTYQASLIIPGHPRESIKTNDIRLADTQLTYCGAKGRLQLFDAQGTELFPAYMGYITDRGLPLSTQTLMLLAPPAHCSLDFFPPPTSEVVRQARLLLGDVVIARESWIFPVLSASMNIPDSLEESLVWWRTMSQHHELPSCGVLRTFDIREGVNKGQFYDAQIMGTILNLIRTLRNAHYGFVIEEFFPRISSSDVAQEYIVTGTHDSLKEGI
ncbi:lantibiotic dehydratase [Corynebacterium pseudotuberculosis]|uniref:lantibiotic dehydratase n=1 Tax=Corynebacterium pseudotuberculosis TaxID=1719 RepID=UPI00115D230F|nr:lantibiotic dehydratase [Corynebacterium pseudotuberculosis]QDL47232.1 Lantibiotic dehydratase, N terminus/C terminus family [Corynebacterium pseudotuberculosis]